MSRQVFEGEYRLGSHDSGQTFNLAPGLDAIFVKEMNELCPSYYDFETECFTAGSISVYFRIGAQVIKLNDKDTHPIDIHGQDIPQWKRFSIGPINYEICGTGLEIEDNSIDKTYLLYKIVRIDNSTAYYRLKYGGPYTNGRVD